MTESRNDVLSLCEFTIIPLSGNLIDKREREREMRQIQFCQFQVGTVRMPGQERNTGLTRIVHGTMCVVCVHSHGG